MCLATPLSLARGTWMLVTAFLKSLASRGRIIIFVRIPDFISSQRPHLRLGTSPCAFIMATPSSPTVGVLGGGQLGRMLMESANRLNIKMNILDADNAPAKQISAHDDHVTGSFKDRESLRKLAASCDILTTEIEHVDTYALEEVSSKVKVEPSWQTIRTIQDKFAQKEHLAQFNIPMAEYRELRSNTSEELASIGKELGYPLMLKSKTQAYDGRGEESPRICTATYLHISQGITASRHRTTSHRLSNS